MRLFTSQDSWNPKNDPTRVPYVPKVLKESVTSWRIIKGEADCPSIGLTLNLTQHSNANPESLKMIRQRVYDSIQERYGDTHEGVMLLEKLEADFPRNTIAVTISKPRFALGNKCDEFTLLQPDQLFPDRSKEVYTYERLSPNIQVTYYTQRRFQTNAGCTYYPEMTRKAKYVERDEKQMKRTLIVDDLRIVTKKRDYCKKSGKISSVTCLDVEEREYDENEKPEHCKMCRREYLNYAAVERKKEEPPQVSQGLLAKIVRNICSVPLHSPKELVEIYNIRRGYPHAFSPVSPHIVRETTNYTTIKGCTSTLSIARATKGSQLVDLRSLRMMNDTLSNYGFAPFDEQESRNVIGISVSESSFQVGDHCEEFSLAPGVKSTGMGSFRFQRFSPNLVATYYIDYESSEYERLRRAPSFLKYEPVKVKYLAGITYYPVRNGKALLLESDRALIKEIQYLTRSYSKPDVSDFVGYTSGTTYGRFCNNSKKYVIVGEYGESKLVGHIGYSHLKKTHTYKSCEECVMHWYRKNWNGPKEEEFPPVMFLFYSTELEGPETSESSKLIELKPDDTNTCEDNIVRESNSRNHDSPMNLELSD